ncbi:MAG TPA: sialidase family protein [Candidatus Thermoplasmatota archaeon]|nr:sialidase family protein [Candidatus Thermoplasmatota archaeon]
MRVPSLVVVLVLASAGCLAATDTSRPEKDVGPPEEPLHVLANATEPADLVAPAFKLLGRVSRAGPPSGAGEPSIWAHLDGTVYLAFPGCDNGNEPPNTPVTPRTPCRNGPVYRSDDQGTTWKRLNRASDGKLDDKGPNANGDNEVTVDAAGTVYASNLGARGIQVWRSLDRGATWEYKGNLTPTTHFADRQWLAGGKAGHLIVTWMGGKTAQGQTPRRSVAVNSTFDSGDTWTGITYIDDAIGWLGPVAFHPNLTSAYIPYTKRATPAGQLPTEGATFGLHMAATHDGGRTWTSLDTKVRIRASGTGGHWSGVHMAPALDVTGDGTIVYAWSEDVLDATGATSNGARVRLMASRDAGQSWTAPTTVSTRTSAIMPWVTGGAGDRAAINYYASDTGFDSDMVGRWDVMVAMVDDVAATPKAVTGVLERDVHFGGLCSRGTGCSAPSDRTLLDFFEADVMPDGRLIVSYAADPHTGGKYAEIRTAIQNGGSPLLVR